MNHKKVLIIGTITLILMTLVIFWVNDVFASEEKVEEDLEPVIDPVLESEALLSESLDYLIYFREQADLSEAFVLPWKERGWFVYDALVSQADQSQEKVRKYLDRRGASYQSFWIENVIAVEDSSARTMKGLLRFSEIESIQIVPVVYLTNPVAGLSEEMVQGFTGATPNLLQINADDAWESGFTGQGLTLGSIDTGVRYTHEALINQYRGYSKQGFFSHDFHWWDAVNDSIAPYDDHGHGTHITGIMVGEEPSGNAIGVAPDAKWVACKAFDSYGGGLAWDLLECSQFLLAPWDLDGQGSNPNLRPHVVNNSWGTCSQITPGWFGRTIYAWQAAGMYPVFADGNGNDCGYAVSPGLDHGESTLPSYPVTFVGSTQSKEEQYASLAIGDPENIANVENAQDDLWTETLLTAPGIDIRSSVSSADNAYAHWGGSSMSTPHVSGLVALMWQAGECLLGDTAQTENLIEKSAEAVSFETGQNGGEPEQVTPQTGMKRMIDAQAAVREAQIYCGEGDEMMLLSGTIRDGSGHSYPLYAKVSLQSDYHNPSGFTDPFSGEYQMKVYKDVVYDLKVESEIEGYQIVEETRLIFDEENIRRDYAMQVDPECDAPGYVPEGVLLDANGNSLEPEQCSAQPGGVLAGYVMDKETGLPAENAAISRDGYIVEARRTPYDPNLQDGFYWAFQPMGTDHQAVSLLVSMDFYRTREYEILITQDAITEKDFSLRHYKVILKEFLTKTWDRIKAFMVMAWEKVLAFLRKLWGSIADFFIMVWEKFLLILRYLRYKILEFLGMLYGKIVDFFAMLWTKFLTWFNSLAQSA
jgi:hypothetical protein